MGDTQGRGLLTTRLEIDASAFVAPNAVVVGHVTLGPEASIWYGCVIRGDLEPVVIGARTNVQDGTIVHVDHERPTLIGADVTIGHRCVIHGATLEDGCLIGMGAVVLSGARVGAGALVAAGALVREGFVVPPGALCVGVPAVVARQLDDAAIERVRQNKDDYIACAREYRDGRLGGGPYGGR